MGVLRRWIRDVSSALLVAWLLSASGGAAARAPQPHIDAIDVERVESLAPGTRLNFSLFGTAGGSAWLRIDGAQRALELREVQPGVYDGSYLIDAQDRVRAGARVQATLRIGDRSTQALLAEPLLLGNEAGAAAEPAAAAVPTPQAAVPSAGTAQAPPADTAPSPPAVSAAMPPADSAPAALPPPVVLPPPFTVAPPRGPQLCSDCAQVESMRRIEPEGPASGGLIATLFGERIAGELDRHFARLQAPLDRAVGRQRLQPRYEATLRLANGERLLRRYDEPPAFKVGDIVPLGANLGGARSERLIDAPATAARREP